MSAVGPWDNGFQEPAREYTVEEYDPKTPQLKEKKKVKLVVARGAHKGVKGRPKGIKGRYSMVDSRMKKEACFRWHSFTSHPHLIAFQVRAKKRKEEKRKRT